jgi:hypothetical protein
VSSTEASAWAASMWIPGVSEQLVHFVPIWSSISLIFREHSWLFVGLVFPLSQ